MFERILVPLDGSKASEMVVPYAVELAYMYNSSIIITWVSESAGKQVGSEMRSYLEELTKEIIQALKRRPHIKKAKSPRPQVTSQTLVGNPALEILNYASSIDCSLIIIANRGASREGFWSLGSVADKILRGASCPVLLVREQLDDSVIALKYLLRKILVPLDGSKLSEIALPLTANLAKETGAEIVLFQVVEPVKLATFSNLPRETIANYNRVLRYTAQQYLEKIKATMADNCVSISVATKKGSIAEMIINYAETNHCDLIAMSTRGRSGIARWVFGSVTEKVLQIGKKPVLAVKPD